MEREYAATLSWTVMFVSTHTSDPALLCCSTAVIRSRSTSRRSEEMSRMWPVLCRYAGVLAAGDLFGSLRALTFEEAKAPYWSLIVRRYSIVSAGLYPSSMPSVVRPREPVRFITLAVQPADPWRLCSSRICTMASPSGSEAEALRKVMCWVVEAVTVTLTTWGGWFGIWWVWTVEFEDAPYWSFACALNSTACIGR